MKKLEEMGMSDLTDTFNEKIDEINDLMKKAPKSLQKEMPSDYELNGIFSFMISQDVNIVHEGMMIDKIYYALFPVPILILEPIVILRSGDDVVTVLGCKEYDDSVENGKLLSKIRTLEKKAKTKMVSNIKQIEDLVDFLHAGLSVSREEGD